MRRRLREYCGRRRIPMRRTNNQTRRRDVALVLILLAIVGFWGCRSKFYGAYKAEKTIENTILKNRTFNASVEEICSPKLGIKAYLLKDSHNPIVSLNFSFENTGYAYDDAHEQGIAQMAAALLTEGAGKYKAQELKEKMEERAIRVGFAAGKDDFGGSLLTTTDHLQEAAQYLNLMLTEPRFDEADLQRVKAQILDALKRQHERPERELELVFAREMYGAHPYGRNPLGQAADIERVSAADLRRFVKNKFSRGNLLVGLAGDVDAQSGGAFLDKVFAGLPADKVQASIPPAETEFDGRLVQIRRGDGQNMLLAAMPAIGRTHKDFYPLFTANYIWGGAGLNSRLSQRIREQEGLTYGIYSYLSLSDKSPLLIVGFAATADNFEKAKKLLYEETDKFVDEGIDAEETAQAKNYLTASYHLRFASIENIAEILTAMQKYNLGLDFLQKRNDYIAHIKPEDVNRVIKKYFNKQLLTGVELGEFQPAAGERK